MSFEKALSSGAKMVNPPEPDVRSCELSWLMSWVVFRSRMRTVNLLAFLRIWTMSVVGPFGMMAVGAAPGVTGTRGTGFNPGAGAAAAGGKAAGGDGGESCANGGDGSDGSGGAGGELVGG